MSKPEDPFASFAAFEAAANAAVSPGTAAVALPDKEIGVQNTPPEPEARKAEVIRVDGSGNLQEEQVTQENDDGGEQHDPADEKIEAEAPPVEKDRPKITRRERIGQLTREKHEAEERASAREADLAARDARIAELERTGGGRREDAPLREEAPTTKPAAFHAPPPDASKFEYAELDPEFTRASQMWAARQALHEDKLAAETTRQAEAGRSKNAELQTKWTALVERGGANHDDFDAVLKPDGKWKLSKDLWELAVDSDVGDSVLHHLATNPAESERIFGLSAPQQGREFAKLEARFSQPPSEQDISGTQRQGGQPAPKIQTPNAPTPIKSARGGGGKLQVTADTTDFSQFEAMANAAQAAGRR